MHIAFNAWFWDQPYTGSGQYLRQLVTSLRQIEPALKLTLVLPQHIQSPEAVPQDVEVTYASTPVGGQAGKVLFEQRSFPAAAGRISADIAHVPYWGAPLQSPARLIVTIHDVIPLSMPVYQQGLLAKLYFSLVTASAKGVG